MPIYEYQCKKCGEFELMQRITDAPLTRCPTCRGKVTKLISNTSFQLKGSGWYVTDYGRKGSGAKDSTPSSEGKTDSKSDSKSETKSETSSEKGGTTEKKAKSNEAAAA